MCVLVSVREIESQKGESRRVRKYKEGLLY